ncbi:MAG TPA: hypothetical protein VG123_24985, partial [Streptosporangiaceae bacterium]|nr:hypothetical protein [Streptosporangiaceae bacterium]
AVAATVIYNLGFILEKRALGRLPAIDAHHLWRLLRTLFTAPAWLAGFTLICCGLVLQVLVLSLVPLTVAQPLQACGVVVTIVFSRLVLHERLGRTELACIAVIAVAVLLLGLSVGRSAGAGAHAAGIAIAAAAAPACLAGLVIYGWLHRASNRRHRHAVSGISYGLCAGLMYGVAGLALKALSAAIFTSRAAPHAAAALAIHTAAATTSAVVPHQRGGGLLVAAVLSPYLYAVLVCSAAGMCLFQTALQRSPASIILPTSNIISTGYLVVVGSWLFHERLPAGPAPLAMRLGGGVAAVAVPVILTLAAEQATSRQRPGGRRHARHSSVPSLSRKGPSHESGPAVAQPAGLPHRQAGAAVPRRGRCLVQPAAAPPLPRPRRHPGHARRPGRDGE